MATWSTSWPALSFSVGYKVSKTHNTIRTPMEAGYVYTRARHTRDRMGFQCGWAALQSSFHAEFSTFVEALKGPADSFEFTDYSSWSSSTAGTTYTVRFQEDTLESQLLDNGRWRVQFTLEEL